MPNPLPIERCLNIRAAVGPSFSPDGRFIAFLTNITGIMQLWGTDWRSSRTDWTPTRRWRISSTST
jgi:Tol biopolymer transport system component